MGSGLVISHLKDSDDREGKKKKREREREKQIGFLQFPWVDFVKGESF